jgi:alcohol dehydrogenase class IV
MEIAPFFTLLPSRTYFGCGIFSRFFDIIPPEKRRILVVTGKSSFTQSAYWDWLKKGAATREIFLEPVSISGEPSPVEIDMLASRYSEQEWEAVVGIGGGSVIDAGKALSAMLYASESIERYLEGIPNGKPYDRNKVYYIACPTTAGTGSEATKNAVMTLPGRNGYKKSLRHDSLIPDIALIDPDLTMSCPWSVTTESGLDALTQLLESYTSSASNAFTDMLAFEGIKSCSVLPRILDKPNDRELRSGMAYAAYLSGVCLTNTGLGVIHGIAGVVGGLYPVGHGALCSALLVCSTQMNLEKLKKVDNFSVIKKYETISNMLFGTTDLVRTLGDWVRKMNIKTLGQLGVRKEDFGKIAKSTKIKNNPVLLSEEDILTILDESY